ncbi:MAG: flagellar hook-associated protein FlgK [Lachnospiraceae bacterium]|nr:flagellar hook-associated protein FlgK [Lachnospiraceae bacterium]
MPSQFFGLNIAYTGLQASNAWLTTTANNIANVETEGYARQKVVQEAGQALRTNTTYGMVGAGVDAKAIEQIRNEFYDLKFWNSNATLGNFEVKEDYAKQIEDYFTETDMVAGFGTIYSDMFAGLEEVYKSAGSSSSKVQFLYLAGNLGEYFSATATNLKKLQEDANLEIKNQVDSINTLASEIASMNKQINAIEINKITANELRDKRSVLVDKLSKIVDVEIQEYPIYTEEGGTIESGANRYIVRIAGGQELVNCYEYNTLNCVARDYKVNQSDAEGLFDIEWSNGLEFNLYGRNLNGVLKGLVEVRDGNNEEYFHGKITNVTDRTQKTDPVTGNPVTDPDTGKPLYESKLTISVDNIPYLQDITKCTLSNTGRILLNNTNFEYTSWSYDAANKEYTFTLDDNNDERLAKDCYQPGKNMEASVGRSIQYQGIPYYQEQMNEWVRQFAKAMNDIEQTAKDEFGNQAEVLFAGKQITDDAMWDFNEDNVNFSSTGDTYYQLTAYNMIVNKNMVKDVSKFLTNKDPDQGQDQQDILSELMDVQTNKDKMSFRGCSSKEFLECVLSDVALNTSNAITFSKNYQNITNSISNQRLSVMGVDNDEEALNLVKFQEAYNLSAKMIQVFTEIYDRLILNTGV